MRDAMVSAFVFFTGLLSVVSGLATTSGIGFVSFDGGGDLKQPVPKFRHDVQLIGCSFVGGRSNVPRLSYL